MIFQFCDQGLTIKTDFLSSYNGLGDRRLRHWIVNHSYTFSDPDTGVNTNLIENLWNLIKEDTTRKHRGVKHSHLQEYLDEFCFRRNFLYDQPQEAHFQIIMQAIATYWNQI